MAYEDMTYEFILQRMLDRVIAQDPNIDTREGSIIFNALAPAAIELAIMYTELENARDESFVNTASREYILLGCEQIGMDVSVFDASAGVHLGVFDVEVPIGSRWNYDLYNYTVTEYLGLNSDGYHSYRMECDTVGTAPNGQTGDLTPITDVPISMTYAKVVECLLDGEDETPDEDIKIAYYEYVKNTATDGNVNQYIRWCNEYPGIGNSKIIPLWNGKNTVKVSILSGTNRKASDELIAEFQGYLDPGSTGMGDGVAPIGAIVTVSTATEKTMNISANVTLKSGYTDTEGISKAIELYFGEISYEKSQLSYMSLGAVILAVEGVESVTNLTINGVTQDIPLGSEEIPVLGTTNWVVS